SAWATNSRRGRRSVVARASSSSETPGKTAAKHRTRRCSISDMLVDLSPGMLDPVIRRRTMLVETFPRQRQGQRISLGPGEGGQERTRWLVPLGLSKLQVNRIDAESIEHGAQRLMLDPARERAAAHDPVPDHERCAGR